MFVLGSCFSIMQPYWCTTKSELSVSGKVPFVGAEPYS